jgi:hypothetical protein
MLSVVFSRNYDVCRFVTDFWHPAAADDLPDRARATFSGTRMKKKKAKPFRVTKAVKSAARE